MADDEEMVSVPKALLANVLDVAESDSYSTQAEFCVGEDALYEASRQQIRRLREIAGIVIEDGAIVGQGFFGMALAAKENN